jgi:ATP synthase protein I
MSERRRPVLSSPGSSLISPGVFINRGDMVRINNHKKFIEKIGTKEVRKVKARRKKDRGIWLGLGMIGTVGWSIAVPTLIGVGLGIWIDKRWPGRISWTLTLLFVGLMFGCINAYYWVRKEITRIEEEQKDD